MTDLFGGNIEKIALASNLFALHASRLPTCLSPVSAGDQQAAFYRLKALHYSFRKVHFVDFLPKPYVPEVQYFFQMLLWEVLGNFENQLGETQNGGV